MQSNVAACYRWVALVATHITVVMRDIAAPEAVLNEFYSIVHRLPLAGQNGVCQERLLAKRNDRTNGFL